VELIALIAANCCSATRGSAQFSCNDFDVSDIGSTYTFSSTGSMDMARSKNIENMSAAELTAMQARIERMKIEKQSSERAAVKQQLMDIAKKAGFDIHELFGRGKGTRGKVAVKYRDGAGNTWTGRGRMPRWMTAATKGGKTKKEDFLVA
jgi:DNA-binding protein H-NS